MGGSTIFHTFGCRNATVYKYLRRLDMAGINFALIGGFLPMSFYNFYCHSWLNFMYCTGQVLSFLILEVCSFQDWFYLRENVKLRSNLFTISGVFSSLPAIHGLIAS
jgi:predicted membrane channel-forming protein YqfA (hemolysin III family)